MKKAGNLTHALSISAGDYIAVIDADFAVRPEFLYETMPYFADPKVGIVQTAQYYDVSNRSFSYIQRYAGTLQEIFFRFIQPARTATRRPSVRHQPGLPPAAVMAAAASPGTHRGGCPLRGEARLAGYETRYLPLCLAKSVAPRDFPSLANQQVRWCRSSMLLMIEKHFREAQFNWQQRAAFWAAFLYYMSSAALLLTGPFPTLTMIWFFPGLIYPHNYLPILPALAASLSVPGAEPRLADDHLSVLIINSCFHIYSVRTRSAAGRPIDHHRRLALRRTRSRDRETDSMHLDPTRPVLSGPAWPCVFTSPAGIRSGPRILAGVQLLHARTTDYPKQGRPNPRSKALEIAS